jgi:outer membrane protein assembly factor BamB
LVADGTVYTVDDVLTALNARTGEHRWQTDLDIEESPNSATRPAVAGDRLLLASNGRLRSFDTSDGSERWKRDVTGSPARPMTVAPDQRMGFVFLRRPEQERPPSELVAFAVESGETEWTAPLTSLRNPPAVVGDSVYVAGWAGPETQVLRRLELDNGRRVWEREVENSTTPPVGTDTGVLIGEGADIRLYDRSDGKRLGSLSVPQGQIRALAVDDGTAFVLAEAGLLAVSVPDGSEQWSRSGKSDYAQANGLAVGRETVVAPVFPEPLDASPSIAAFDRADGTPRWHYAIDEAFSPTIVAPPVLADGAVFVMSNTENGVTALGDLPPREGETTSSG